MKKILLLLLLLPIEIWGANATSTVSSGGDYASVQARVADDTTLSSGDTLFVEISIAGTDSCTGALDFTGWVTTGAYVYFKVMPTYRYDGTLDTTNHYYFKSVNGNDWEINREGTFIFDGFQFGGNNGNTIPPIKDAFDGSQIYFLNCLWYHCYRAFNPGVSGSFTASSYWFVNNYFDSVAFANNNGTTLEVDAGSTYVYFCTFYNSAEAIDQDGGYLEVINSVMLDCDAANNCLDLTAGTRAISYSRSDDMLTDSAAGTGWGAGLNTPGTITFVDSSGGLSMLLASSDAGLIDSGTTISAYGTDVEGETRDASPDIGYDEYVVAGASATVIRWLQSISGRFQQAAPRKDYKNAP